MKNKILLMLVLSLMLMCALAVFANAEETQVIPEWKEPTIISSMPAKDGFDTTSRVMLVNADGTYTTYPAYYIIDGSDDVFDARTELVFTNLKDETGEEYTYSSVVRFEMPAGYVTVAEKIFRPDKGFTALLTLKVPEGVTSFGIGNFYDASNPTIQEVEFPNSLTLLGEKFCQNQTSIRKVSIGSGTEIGAYAFDGCTALESVIIAEGVTTIGGRAFKGCSSLTGVALPKSLTSIGTYAFYLSAITEITIPGTSTVIDSYAFSECNSLTKVVISASEIGEYAFQKCTSLKTVILEEGVVTIGNRAFLNSSLVETVELPDSLTSIGISAFYGCAGIKEIVIPENVTTIGTTAFQGCAALTKAVIKCKIMGSSMFINDSNLSVLVLPADISSIGSNALSGVKNGTFLTIYVGDDPERLGTLNTISRFTSADYVTYEQYLLDVENGVSYTKNTIVYGANYCVELNDGQHQLNDGPTCTQAHGCTKCDDVLIAPALGHSVGELVGMTYVTFDQNGDKLYDCTRCEDNIIEEDTAGAIFGAVGYSTNSDQNALDGGFTFDSEAYSNYFGATNDTLRFGIIIVNAESFAQGASMLNEQGKLNSTLGMQVEMTSTEYSTFSCSITGFDDTLGTTLKLIITLYVIDSEGEVSYIQAENNYAQATSVGDVGFDSVTLSLVVSNTTTSATAYGDTTAPDNE